MLVVNHHGEKEKQQKKYTYCDLGGTWFCLGANPQQPNNTFFGKNLESLKAPNIKFFYPHSIWLGSKQEVSRLGQRKSLVCKLFGPHYTEDENQAFWLQNATEQFSQEGIGLCINSLLRQLSLPPSFHQVFFHHLACLVI